MPGPTLRVNVCDAGSHAATGLSSAEATQGRALRMASSGGECTSRSVGEILRANILTRFNVILGVLLAVILTAGEPQDALFGIILVADAAIGIGQELRAKRTPRCSPRRRPGWSAMARRVMSRSDTWWPATCSIGHSCASDTHAASRAHLRTASAPW